MKTRNTGELVEVKLNFKVSRPDFPVVEQALNSLLALVKHKVRPVNEDGDELYTFAEVFPEAHPGMAVRGFRSRDRLTQEELAKRLGIAQTRVSELESGKRRISIAMAKRLSAVFDIPYQAFL
jgi:DNA-binding XRE family transcriptional regulator